MALEAYLMAFIGMPSGPVAFLGFKDFIIKLISTAVGFGKSKQVKLLEHSLILIMLGWFL